MSCCSYKSSYPVCVRFVKNSFIWDIWYRASASHIPELQLIKGENKANSNFCHTSGLLVYIRIFTDTSAYHSYGEHKEHTIVTKDFFFYICLYFGNLCLQNEYFDLLVHHNYGHQHYQRHRTGKQKLNN